MRLFCDEHRVAACQTAFRKNFAPTNIFRLSLESARASVFSCLGEMNLIPQL